MRKARKGFTLVELLIVVAIMATLTAAMTMAVSGSTAKAKASTIASNVNACRNAAMAYSITEGADSIANLTADDVLFAKLPSWKDFNNTNNKIKYAAVTGDDGTGPEKWAITVDFSGDGEKDAIVKELEAINGYNKSYSSATDGGTEIFKKAKAADGDDPAVDATYSFKVTLLSGKIEASS